MIRYIIIVILIALCIFLYIYRKKSDEQILLENNKLYEENRKLNEVYKTIQQNCELLNDQYNAKTRESEKLKESIEQSYQRLEKEKYEEEKLRLKVNNLIDQEKAIYDRIDNANKLQERTLETQEKIVNEAFGKYCDNLELNYQKKDEEYGKLREMLEQAYDERHKRLIAEAAKEEEELGKVRATRTAAIEALRREKEILSDNSFYCLQVSDEDKSDISRLENIKKTLNKPRVLSMLIWSTYYQKELKSLSANILGTSIKTGIYKITNIITGEVYIGQAVDIAKRWTEHAKHGLGIDTPAGNKLYKSMQEYGLHSFSWELLEECESKLLNEKERFYIDLYQSVDFGYNSNKGVS